MSAATDKIRKRNSKPVFVFFILNLLISVPFGSGEAFAAAPNADRTRASRAKVNAEPQIAAVVPTNSTAAATSGPYLRPGETRQVSVSSDGAQVNGNSYYAAISADGRYVAFNSNATNLVPGKTNSQLDVFVCDLGTGVTERVSVASDGSEANHYSLGPSISADGRYVAFQSYASNLVPGDRYDGHQQIYVHDRVTGKTERVSVASDGTKGNDESYSPSISGDGRYIAFVSVATNLVPNDNNNTDDVFVHDRVTGTTERVSVAGDGSEGNALSYIPSISGDGRYVAFASVASNLAANDNNNTEDIFVHDRTTGATELVSVASDGTGGNDFSDFPAISADGRYVAFVSAATNFVPADTNGGTDIFVRDRLVGVTERVSVASDGTEANKSSAIPSISGNGRYVVFESSASNLAPDNDPNSHTSLFVHDRITGATERVSRTSESSQLEGFFDSYSGAISADGRYVVFSHEVFNSWENSFVRDRGRPLMVGDLSVGQSGNTLSISGWATFSGTIISSGTDPAGDSNAADLLAVSLTYRPENADVLVRLTLSSISNANGTVAPGVLYGLRFSHGGLNYEIRATSTTNGPDFELFQCNPTCTQQTNLTGGLGTTGTEVRVSLPDSVLNIAEGAALTGIQAFTALGNMTTGTAIALDQVDLPNATVPQPSVSFGVAPLGSSESQVTFDSLATLRQGNFTGAIDLPPNNILWARACLGTDCSSSEPRPAQLTTMVSRKIHGSAGAFDLDLPLDGSGIECRSGGVNGDYTIVFTFANPLTNVGPATITKGTGSVSTSNIDPNDAHNYIVNLTGVTNAQAIAISLTNVADSAGSFSAAIPASLRVLIGDTTANGVVDSSDIAQTQSQSGHTVTSANFREDVTASGSINSSDIALVQSKSGTGLP